MVIDDGKMRIEVIPLIIRTVLLTVLTVLLRGTFPGIVMLLFCPLICIISTSDLKHKKIPNVILGLMLIPVVADFVLVKAPSWQERLIAAAIIFFPLLLLGILSHKGVGAGDIKLLTVCALLLGYNILISLAAGVILLAGCMVVMIATKKFNLKTKLPAGPYFGWAILIMYMLVGRFGYM